jgi:hypothetical protein
MGLPESPAKHCLRGLEIDYAELAASFGGFELFTEA